jgi:hypothetical protein
MSLQLLQVAKEYKAQHHVIGDPFDGRQVIGKNVG